MPKSEAGLLTDFSALFEVLFEYIQAEYRPLKHRR